MLESAALFGAEENLIGILTEPRSAREDAPTVIMLNAGVVHRVGPHRLHVALARRLAEKGIRSFRIDLSGIGDSRSLEGTESFRERAVIDTRAAMDHLAKTVGAKTFALFGLCAGADNSIATALADERAKALVLVDPYAYATIQSRGRKVVARAKKLGSVSSVLKWGASVAIQRASTRFAAVKEPADEEESPTSSQSGRVPPPSQSHGDNLDQLVAKGVAIFAIFSASNVERYNGPGQLFEVFPQLRGRVDEQFFPHANHTFTELSMQRELMDSVSGWLEKRRR